MLNRLKYILILCLCLGMQMAFAQLTTTQQSQTNAFLRDTVTRRTSKTLTPEQMMDSLRKKENNKKDSVIFSAKFIRVTNELLLNDSTQVLPLDTGLVNFENYNPLYQIRSPK